MTDGVDTSFRRFVRDERPALLGTALLLSGDQANAELLVQEALSRSYRSWARLIRTGDPAAAVRKVLIGRSTGWRARVSNREQVMESLPDPYAPALPDSTAGIPRVLRELPPQTRAAVVLRSYLELSDADAAQVLGRTPDTVRTEVTRGLAELRDALGPGAPGSGGDVQRVRDQLVGLAEAPVRWTLDTDGAVADVRRRLHGHRRRLAAGAVAALCAVGVAVPLVRSTPDTAPPGIALPSTGLPGPVARSVPVLVGPTRGSLAGDRAFLDAVRRVGWGAQEAPPVAERDVVLAGDTPAGRVVLLVGTVDEDFRGVWLTGPVGAAPEELALHVPRQLGRDRPLSLMLSGGGAETLVVVAGREDRVEVSDRLKIGPLGTVARSYDPVEVVDGVAVVPARATANGPATSVRVLRDGRVAYRSGVDWLGDRPGPGPELPPLDLLRPVTDPPDARLVSSALAELAVPLGVEPPALEPEILWSGRLPQSRRPGTVVVLLAHSPGGALVVTTWAGDATTAVPCGVQTPPGNAAVALLTVARACSIPSAGTSSPGTGRSEERSWLVVTAPATAATADVFDPRGRLLTSVALEGGSAVLPLPRRANAIRTYDGSGRAMADTPIAPMATEPFGDFGSGPER